MNIQAYRDYIIDCYTSHNLTTTQIARELGCSSSSVGRLLVSNGIKPYHTPNELRISEEDADSIVELYKSGNTTTEIAEMFSICDASVAKILKNKGVDIRPAYRRSAVKNHDFFHDINAVNKAYFLGWMISDGAIIESKTRPGRSDVISLEIKTADRYILELFAESLGADISIVKENSRRYHSYIRFASAKMSEDLSTYGVIPRKSLITYLPTLRDDMMPHLIRGIFDGDGTITLNNGFKHFAFYGSKELCESIRNYLSEKIGLRYNKVSKSTCYHVWWGGDKQASAFSDYIYDNCGNYYLSRKRDRFA